MAALLAVIAGGIGAACDGNDSDTGSRQVAVLVVAIRDVVGLPIAAVDEALPVVYVVGFGEHDVPATVQSDVAAELHDEVDVRFADDRDEAIETGEADQPVPDSGVLLVVGDIPDRGSPIDVPIEVYRSQRDGSVMMFTLSEGPSSWVVTATSLVTAAA